MRTMDMPVRAISPNNEMGAYEALWLEKAAGFRAIARRFAAHPDALPSKLVSPEKALEVARAVHERLVESGTSACDVCVRGMAAYPMTLRDAEHPVEFFYYQGQLNLLESPCVAVIGTRKPTDDGKRRAGELVTRLVSDGWTIVSGLAAGIDTEAHKAAIAADGRTVAVLGTPITQSYPVENRGLQTLIAVHHLVLSQVPILRYELQSAKLNKRFFPLRNITMAALSRATIIVEASENSGTYGQAREGLRQGRKVFILDHCFENAELTWPARLAALGAIRLKSFDEIKERLGVLLSSAGHAERNDRDI